jgi:hypothetical protein
MPAVFCKGLNFPLWTTNWGMANITMMLVSELAAALIIKMTAGQRSNDEKAGSSISNNVFWVGLSLLLLQRQFLN